MKRLLIPLAIAAAAPSLRAQAVLRGTVTDDTGARLPFAVVVLDPGFRQRFADSLGNFAFGPLAPGAYRIQVRQVGFVPVDTGVTVGAEPPAAFAIRLARVPVQLAPIAVTAVPRCLAPGPPSRESDPALVTLFEQLRENALRYRLLSDAYPHRATMVRYFTLDMPSGRSIVVRTDTLEIRSDDRNTYRIGRVVRDIGRQRFVVLPTLPDLADSAFQSVHCFHAQADVLGDAPMLRLDFQAAEALRSSDVDGSAWLDARTYQLHRLEVRLTRPDRSGLAVSAMSGAVTFREILPAVIAPARVTAFATYRNPRGAEPVGHVEEQHVIGIRWTRQPPGGAAEP